MQLLFSLEVFQTFLSYIYIIVNLKDLFFPTYCSLSFRLLMSYKKHWARWEKLRVRGIAFSALTCSLTFFMLDCCSSSALASLQDFRRAEVVCVSSLSFNISVHSQNENHLVFLNIQNFYFNWQLLHFEKGCNLHCYNPFMQTQRCFQFSHISYLNLKAYFKKNLLCR